MDAAGDDSGEVAPGQSLDSVNSLLSPVIRTTLVHWKEGRVLEG